MIVRNWVDKVVDKVAEDLKRTIEDNCPFKKDTAYVTLEQLRIAWEAGFKIAVRYNDNYVHFDGEQKEREWQEFLKTLS